MIKNYSKHTTIWPSIVIIGVFLLTYSPVITGEFLSWDDKDYILNNSDVRTLNFDSIGKYFSKPYLGNYHPLTMLSYSIQFLVFEENAIGYHIISLIIHILNFTQVLWFANFLLKDRLSAWVVSALFLLHPINVESVAWISEQKNLLYVLFLLISLRLYFEYLDKKIKLKYVFSLLAFIFAVLSKAQAVSLPIIIICIEFIKQDNFKLGKVLIDKIPYFLISVFFGIIAIYAQDFDGYINESHNYDSLQKLFIYSYDYLFYFVKIIFPLNLKAYYPYMENIHSYYSVLSILILVLFLISFYLYKKRKQKLFLATLLMYTSSVGLVIQIIPLGEAMVAERYAYLPSIFVLTFFVSTVEKHVDLNKIKIKAIISILILTVFSLYTFSRVSVWKDDSTFFSDLLTKLPENEIILNSSAAHYMLKGEFQEAETLLAKATAIDTNYFQAYFNLGLSKLKLEKIDEAIIAFNKVEKTQRDFFETYYYKGICFQKKNDFEQSILEFNKVISIKNTHYDSYLQRAICFGKLNKFSLALFDLEFLISRNYKPEMTYYLSGLAKFKLNKNGCDDIILAKNFGNLNADMVLATYCK